MVVGSTDFQSYYPRLPVQRAAHVVNEMIQGSDVKIMTDDRELGLFLASTMKREEAVEQGLGEVVQERLHSAGAAPAPLCKCLALILGFGQCKIRTYEPSNWPANKVML